MYRVRACVHVIVKLRCQGKVRIWESCQSSWNYLQWPTGYRRPQYLATTNSKWRAMFFVSRFASVFMYATEWYTPRKSRLYLHSWHRFACFAVNSRSQMQLMYQHQMGRTYQANKTQLLSSPRCQQSTSPGYVANIRETCALIPRVTTSKSCAKCVSNTLTWCTELLTTTNAPLDGVISDDQL